MEDKRRVKSKDKEDKRRFKSKKKEDKRRVNSKDKEDKRIRKEERMYTTSASLLGYIGLNLP